MLAYFLFSPVAFKWSMTAVAHTNLYEDVDFHGGRLDLALEFEPDPTFLSGVETVEDLFLVVAQHHLKRQTENVANS